uniref:Calcineurin-like phosphoesterase domain-containing protein n=2 Tax=Amblyomma TaxID=6942 RepID=G3MKH6_AMBMU
MGAMASVLLYTVRTYFHDAASPKHPLGLPMPPLIHKTLTPEYIESFKQVFVIGDVHGCYEELMDLLAVAKVKEKHTLKLFVGDLVNKGPKSEEVLDYLISDRASCHAVRGNHDEVVLKEYYASRSLTYALSPENTWINRLTARHVRYLEQLPYTLLLPSLNTVIVHAGLVPGQGLSTSLADMVTMRNVIIDDYWEKDGIKATCKDEERAEPWGQVWNGPQHVIFGHDAKRNLQTWQHCTGLDTGCVYGNALTGMFIAGPRAGELVSVKAKCTHQRPREKRNEDCT